MDKLKSLLTSRRFWVAVFGVVAIVSSKLFGVELDTEQLVSIVMVILGWILGDSIRKTE